MPSTLRSQISLAFGLLVISLAAALSFGLADQDAQVVLADQGDALHLLAQGTATVLADGLFERMREVELLSAAAPYKSDGKLDLAAWQPVIERTQATRPQFSWIGVTDAGGKVLYATGGMLVGKDVSERPWFRSAQDKPFTGDVHVAKLLAALLPPSVTGEPLRFLDFAAPLHDPAGRYIGVLGVHATWDWAHEVVSSLRSSRSKDNGVQVFVLDRNSEVLYHPAGLGADIKPMSLGELPGEGGLDVIWTDQQHYLTSAVRVPARSRTTDMQWTVLARQHMEIATSASRDARVKFLGVGLIAALIAMVLAWWLAGQFSRSLAVIAHAARRVEAGALDVVIPVIHDIREVSQLSYALRGMQSTLLEREAALARSNVELEARVIERTAELASAQDELLQANAALTALAQRDGLTGLFNRRAADERLQMEVVRHRRTGGSLSLLLLDIDHFKSVNDSLGHAAGDEVLKLVAAELSTSCRLSDFVARFGGEEFLMLLPDTPPAGALVFAEKVRAAVEANQRGPKRVTISIGIAKNAELFDDASAALRTADEALYAAKAAGRNRVIARSSESGAPARRTA